MRYLALLLSIAGTACSSGNPENSFICGFGATVGASMVLEQLRTGSKVLMELPDEFRGTVPVRVVGYGTQPGLVAETPDGALLGYEGEGFPVTPGFGLALVEDSADVFQGVLVYDIQPPIGYPQLGLVTSGSSTIPLYGLRVTWAAVSSPRCPMFGPLDSTTSSPDSG